jgi:hypothetical protein
MSRFSDRKPLPFNVNPQSTVTAGQMTIFGLAPKAADFAAKFTAVTRLKSNDVTHVTEKSACAVRQIRQFLHANSLPMRGS